MNQEGGNADSLEGKLAAVGWGIFFLWLGLAVFGGLSIGIMLLGIGVITLVMQVVRSFLGLALEGFWIFAGLLFTLGGLGEIFRLNFPFVPVILVAVGLLLLFSALKRKD